MNNTLVFQLACCFFIFVFVAAALFVYGLIDEIRMRDINRGLRPIVPYTELVLSGSQYAVCEWCGRVLGKHPRYKYLGNLRFDVVRACDGRYYKI